MSRYPKNSCASCSQWKRRNDTFGTCWHPENHNRTVRPYETCAHFTARFTLATRNIVHVTAKDGQDANQ